MSTTSPRNRAGDLGVDSNRAGDPTGILTAAAAASEQAAEEMQIAARRAGWDASRAWLTAAAITVRSVLPTAHRLVVDTASWLDQRGENRPDIVEVFDRDGNELYDCYQPSDVDDLTLDEAGTLLDHALRYADPWTIEPEWEGRETEYGPTYDVTLPDLAPDLEAACQQLAGEGTGTRP